MNLFCKNWIPIVFIIFHTFPHLPPSTAASFERRRVIDFDTFRETHESSLAFLGTDSRIQFGALQLTPDTLNAGMIDIHYNKSGRIMFKESFRLWSSGNDTALASFNAAFVINIFRDEDWTAGHGLAFLIAPNISSMPENSYGRWLGLTNESTDGSSGNQIVAVEFDTLSQPDSDEPDGNHIGLNVNSVESRKVAALNNITLSPNVGTNYSVWVDYNGTSKLLEVYIARERENKPSNPVLNDTIDLKQYVKQDSYFGFSGSTGYPEIELNCVLQWSLDIDFIPKDDNDDNGLKIGLAVGVPLATILISVLTIVGVVRYRRRRKGSNEGGDDRFGKLKWLPGMPREFKYKELKKATNNFDERMKLGEGGFGVVYKGVLNVHHLHDKSMNYSSGGVGGGNNQDHAIQVAVKKFLRDSIKGKDDFLAELAIIHRLRHRNLVRLVGKKYSFFFIKLN